MYITFGNVTLISCLQLNAKKTVDYAAQKPMQLGSPNMRRSSCKGTARYDVVL